MTDSEKLRKLADWMDQLGRVDIFNTHRLFAGETNVFENAADLRRIASRLEALELQPDPDGAKRFERDYEGPDRGAYEDPGKDSQ